MQKARLKRSGSSQAGFSMMDTLMMVAVMSILMAIAVPSGRQALDSMELTGAIRQVERELHTARLRAVSANRRMRVRLNCPDPNTFRLVEVTGVAATDLAADRCDPNSYPYPGPTDTSPATPTHDGPMRYLARKVDALTGPELEFSPNGTTRTMVGGVPQPIVGDVTLSVDMGGETKEITVNGMGRVQLVQ